MSTAVSNRVRALAGVVGTVCHDTADLLVFRDLAEQVGQNRVILPFLTGCIRRTYAAIFSFMVGVMLPMPLFGRSLL